MEKKKLYLMIIVIIAVVVIGAVLTLLLSDQASTMVVSFLGGQTQETKTQSQSQPSTNPLQQQEVQNTTQQGGSGGVMQVEEDESMQEYAGQAVPLSYAGGSVTECQTKWDCPDHKPCWSGMCKEPIMRTAKYQVWGSALALFTPYWSFNPADWFGFPGKGVYTFVIAFRAKRADVDVTEVNLPSSSVAFADALFDYLVQGQSLYQALGISHDDYVLENGVLFKGGKDYGDQTRTGDDLGSCISLPGGPSKQGVGCIRQQVNNIQQFYFRGRTSVYFDGGPQGGAYFKYVPDSSTKWWNDFIYFVVAVAPMHPEGS